MRILFFHAYPHQYAGAQRITQALALELMSRGHSVLVVLPDEGPFFDRLRREGVPTRIVAAPNGLKRYGRQLEGARGLAALPLLPGYWRRLRREIRMWQPDVVHVNDHRGALLAAPAARLARTPVVWHLHGSYASIPLTLLGGALSKRIVVVSEATRAEQAGLRPFARKTTVVHNGLLTATASPSGQGRDRDALRKQDARSW